jgi:putative ABC transport system permease protein
LSIPFDWPTLAFTAAAALLSVSLFGIAPAGQVGRVNTSEALKEGGRSATEGRERTRLRTILVTAEVALALVLSIGAGLLLRSLQRLQQVDLGFQPSGVATASFSLPQARYQDEPRVDAFYRAVMQRLRALPGVTSVAAAYGYPFGLGSEGRTFQIVGRAPRPGEPALEAEVRLVTPEFFSTLRIPLHRGRAFTDQEGRQSEFAAVIDERLAHQYWPNQDPLGQQIILQGGQAARIIGVAGHTKQSDLASNSEKGIFYFSLYQAPVAFGTLLVRTAANPEGLTKSIQEAVRAVDPATPLYDAQSMQERVSATLAGRRFTIVLLALFAAAAVFLAALGLYGVINYGVTQRTQEIGIRMALGAQRSQVLALILGGGMRLTVAGLALGWLAAFASARLVPNQLFGVGAFDPLTFAAMAILLAAVALLASAIPAHRAMNLDPLEACRYE